MYLLLFLFFLFLIRNRIYLAWKNKISLSTITSYYFRRFLFHLLTSINLGVLHKLNDHTFEVNYLSGNQIYTIRVHRTGMPRGPPKVISIRDEQDNDITHVVHRYGGPFRNFHGRKFTPKDLNKQFVKAKGLNNEEFLISEDQEIKFS